jgi:hypothetical protein
MGEVPPGKEVRLGFLACSLTPSSFREVEPRDIEPRKSQWGFTKKKLEDSILAP